MGIPLNGNVNAYAMCSRDNNPEYPFPIGSTRSYRYASECAHTHTHSHSLWAEPFPVLIDFPPILRKLNVHKPESINQSSTKYLMRFSSENWNRNLIYTCKYRIESNWVDSVRFESNVNVNAILQWLCCCCSIFDSSIDFLFFNFIRVWNDDRLSLMGR